MFLYQQHRRLLKPFHKLLRHQRCHLQQILPHRLHLRCKYWQHKSNLQKMPLHHHRHLLLQMNHHYRHRQCKLHKLVEFQQGLLQNRLM
jgi:hypothetical protein